VPANGQSLNVFEHENLCPKFSNDSNKLLYQLIPRIVEYTLTHQRESLTWRPPEDDVYGPPSDLSGLPDLDPRKPDDRADEQCSIRKVEVVDGSVDGIELDGGGNVESRLLEAERHPSGTSEEIDGKWPISHLGTPQCASGAPAHSSADTAIS
jgi:hypothetical protein